MIVFNLTLKNLNRLKERESLFYRTGGSDLPLGTNFKKPYLLTAELRYAALGKRLQCAFVKGARARGRDFKLTVDDLFASSRAHVHLHLIHYYEAF